MTKILKLKFFLKFFGIGAAITVGMVGLVSAYLGITGGFNPVIIEPASIAFDVNNKYYQQDTPQNSPVFVVSDDFCLKVNPNPENATELDAKLKVDDGANLIKNIQVKNPEVDDLEENVENLYIDAEKDSVGYYSIKLGEEFKVILSENHALENERMIQFYVETKAEETATYCRAKILVDVKLESFSLKSTKIGTGDNLFPTDEFYVSVNLNSVAPSTALKQSALSQLTNKNKTVEYKVTEGFDIVSILSTSELDENGIPMAKVRVNDAKSGNFAITAYICDKYENVAKIKTDAEYSALTEEERQRYNAETYGGTIFDADSNEIVFEGFMISSSIQLKSEALEVESISAISNIDDCKLFKTYRKNPEDLNLKINPKNIPGSHYTSEALIPYIDDLEVSAGYYVNSQSEADLTIEQNGQEKYIKFSDRFLDVIKEPDGDGGFMWAITVKDYTLNNCIVFALTDYSVSGDNTSQGYVEPKYCVIDVEVDEPVIPGSMTLPGSEDIVGFGIMIDENATELNTQKIALSYDSNLDEQTDFFDLSNAKLVLTKEQTSEPLKEFGNVKLFSKSDSDYKTTLFVTKDEDDKYSLQNDVIKIENRRIIPLSTGRSYLYSILVQTDINGNIVDEAGNPIENEEDIISNCVVKYYTSSIIIDVYQVLKISTENTIELYKSNDGMEKIEDGDELFEIERFNGEIGIVNMYKGTELFLKLNVNDQDAYKYAYDIRNLTFSCDSNLVSIGNMVKESISGVATYLLPIKVMDTDENEPNASVVISFKQNEDNISITLIIHTHDFILDAINLSSNGVQSADETIDAVVVLSLDSSSSEYYWTASNDLSENKELVITSKIYPTQAIIAGMIDYAIYSYPQEFDIHSSTLNAEFIADNLILSSDVIELKGNPQVDEDYNDILTFIIKKAGRAVVIASYTRSDGVTIYSNAFVIETVYPYFAEEEYNFGRNSAEYTAFEEYEEENYRIITTTYDNQKTDLLEFTHREGDGIEDVEGYKLRLKYKYQNLEEIAYSSLNEGLYDFEIEIVNQVAYAVDDFAIIFEDNHPYLVTPKVSEKVYLKLKVTTKFGYKLSQTYNYVLQPDYEVEVDKNSDNMIEINLSEFDNGNRINLFDYLIENDEIINNGGKVFITNNFIYSNNCDDNEEHITGGGTIIKKIVYLPNGMEINEEDIPDGYEVKSILKLYIQSEIIDIDHNGEAMYIDDISQVTSDYIIGFKLFFWADEDMSVPEIVFEGQIKIIYDLV